VNSFDYDLVVIGAGSGGLAAAERAAAFGAKVAIVEHANVGGACINYCCIPEKLLDYAASFKQQNSIATSYGWSDCDRHFEWLQFMAAKDQHIRHLNQVHLHHLEDAGVHFVQGHAAFSDPHTLIVENRPITANKILISVGAKPSKPNIPGVEHTITWRELYHLPAQPALLHEEGLRRVGTW
jgi:glutathione reductase (NADPH)